MKTANMSNKSRLKKPNKVIIILKKVLIGILSLLILYSVLFITNQLITSKNYIKLFGITIAVQRDDTMKDKLNNNDLLIFKEIKKEDLKEGDIIGYDYSNYIVAHRITNIHTNNGNYTLITKGDNNLYNDIEEKTGTDIEGVLICSIPIIGILLTIFESKIVVILLIIFSILKFAYNKEKQKREVRRNRKKQGYY